MEKNEELQWLNVIAKPSRLPMSSRKRQRFGTYHPKNESQNNLKRTCQYFLNGEVRPPLLLIVGTNGLGKTHMAWAVAWEYLENWEQVRYYQAEELLDSFRNSLGSGIHYENVVKSLREIPLLIIDDLGAQSETEWGMAKFDMLIDYRYREEKETIITANTLELPPRIVDRCRHGAVVMVKGESHRGEVGNGQEKR